MLISLELDKRKFQREKSKLSKMFMFSNKNLQKRKKKTSLYLMSESPDFGMHF